MAVLFSDLLQVDQLAILAGLAEAPPQYFENLLADILKSLPSNPTHEQITDSVIMALAPAGVTPSSALGLSIICDQVPFGGGGAVKAAASAV